MLWYPVFFFRIYGWLPRYIKDIELAKNKINRLKKTEKYYIMKIDTPKGYERGMDSGFEKCEDYCGCWSFW